MIFIDPRRGVLSVICIGAPIIAGLATGLTGAGLVGGIAGLLLTLSDTEGSLRTRLLTTLGVAAGIAGGGALGAWLEAEHPLFWIAFFAGVFAAGNPCRVLRALPES